MLLSLPIGFVLYTITDNPQIAMAASVTENFTSSFWNNGTPQADPGSDLTVSDNEVVSVNLSRNVTTYFYRDFGADYFNNGGNFTHKFTTAYTYGANSGVNYIWALTDNATDWNTLDEGNGSALGLWWYYTATDLRLRELVAGTATANDDSSNLAQNTEYYVTIDYNSSNGTYGTLVAYIATGDYHGEVGASDVDAVVITLTANFSFRYVFNTMSNNTGYPTHVISTYIRNLNLGDLPISVPTMNTTAADNISATSVNLNGSILSTMENCDYRGFRWKESSSGSWTDNWTESGNFTAGSFSHQISSLSEETRYDYQVMAHNSGGWGYGDTISFTPIANIIEILADGTKAWHQRPETIHNPYPFITYTAWVNSVGDIGVTSVNHTDNNSITSFTLEAAFEVDDHDVPALWIDPDGYIHAFYTKHGAELSLHHRTSSNPYSIATFEADDPIATSNVTTYVQPVYVPDEGVLYLYYRWGAAGTYQWRYVYSEDYGSTWSGEVVFVDQFDSKRPYTEPVLNGTNRIDYVVSPSNGEDCEDAFHFYKSGSNYYKSDGTLIGDNTTLPFVGDNMTKLYDHTVTGYDSKVWDIAIDDNGYPVILIDVFVNISTDHRYNYATFNGTDWTVQEICEAGAPIQGSPQRSYAAGMYLDRNDTNIVYAGRNVGDYWEMDKYTTADGGATWDYIHLYNPNTEKSIRPKAVVNSYGLLDAVWATGTYNTYTSYNLTLYGYFTNDYPNVVPPPPTNVSATDGSSSENVTITWTKVINATGYYVRRDGVQVSGLLGDVATYTDTTADAPTITPGSSVATDGSSTSNVSLSISGLVSNNGTAHAYDVVANNAAGNSTASDNDTGFRGTTTLTYQWYISAGDSDASYSIIAGATSPTYTDNTSPSGNITAGTASASDATSLTVVVLSLSGELANDGAGRYWKAEISMTGASSQNSTADRGYKGIGTLTYQWQRSAADSDAAYSNIIGATTDPYNDTGGVASPDGRYYRCVLNADGATQTTSSADRGNMILLSSTIATNTRTFASTVLPIIVIIIIILGVKFTMESELNLLQKMMVSGIIIIIGLTFVASTQAGINAATWNW